MSTNTDMDTSTKEPARKRSWPEALRRQIVAASLEPGATVAQIARTYNVHASQVFKWRKLYRDKESRTASPDLVPVLVAADRPAEMETAPAADTIEIELGSGHRVRVSERIKAQALRLVLDVLEGRGRAELA